MDILAHEKKFLIFLHRISEWSHCAKTGPIIGINSKQGALLISFYGNTTVSWLIIMKSDKEAYILTKLAI